MKDGLTILALLSIAGIGYLVWKKNKALEDFLAENPKTTALDFYKKNYDQIEQGSMALSDYYALMQSDGFEGVAGKAYYAIDKTWDSLWDQVRKS